MTLLQKVKSIATTACPTYHFVFETDKMANVLADDAAFPMILMSEFYDSSYQFNYGWRRKAKLELSFMKLAEFQGDAESREVIREQIRSEAVQPFLAALEQSGHFDSIEFKGNAISSPNEPPRFDANAVSVFLRFDVTFRECVSHETNSSQD